MKKTRFPVAVAVLFTFAFNACDSGDSGDNNKISIDADIIARGEASFNTNCSSCHNFRQDGIGPQLADLTNTVPAVWIRNFVKDPQHVINSGDVRARQLFNRYKAVMPSFASLPDDEREAIIAFLNTQKSMEKKADGSSALKNPIPKSIPNSGLVASLELLTQFPSSVDSGNSARARITKLDYQPGSGSLFVVDQRGRLYRLEDNKPAVYLDLASLKPGFIDQPGFGSGFGSFAFHPRYATNGLFYTTHTENGGSAQADFTYSDSIRVRLQWVLTEWKADRPEAGSFSGTSRELLRVNMVAPNHGVQEITFNPFAKPGDEDFALLYIGIGDGGSVENGYPSLVHSPERVWGSVLRIDPAGRNSANGKYGIPPQNPFAKTTNAEIKREVYAFGFRNPHRITWSSKRQMLVTNIGHGNIESVNLVVKGHDYGWPLREGSFLLNPLGEMNKVYPLPADDSSYHITYPVAEYDHDEGKAISGGFEYTGSAVPALHGKFLFGDIPTGRLFWLNMRELKQGKMADLKAWMVSVNGTVKTLAELCGNERVDLHFGKDARGEIYIMTKADGKLYKITGASVGN